MIIHSGQPERPDYLCDLIRSNTPLLDLAAYVKNVINADPELLQLSQQIMRSSDGPSQSPAAIGGAAEERIRLQSLQLPISLAAYPWTNLASDEVVSHLVSLYFTWEQPCVQFIDKNAFLADMKAADVSRSDGFCSPLLVSALLAQACVSHSSSSRGSVIPI